MHKKIWKEQLYPSIGQYLQIENIIFSQKTKFQKLLLVKNKILGKTLIIDNIIQTAEYDEFIYHEMICLIPFFTHNNPQNILIIGGGDGGCLKKLIKFKNIKSIILVEIDKEIINCAKKYLFKKKKNPFKDKRVTIKINDGLIFFKKNKKKFDLIIIDSTDPIGPGKKLFSTLFYKKCYKFLKKGGILTSQNGTYMFQNKDAIKNFQNLNKIFNKVKFYQASIPTYYGGNMLFLLASKKNKLNEINKKKIYNKIKNLKFKYYNYKIHKSSFALPNFLIKKIKKIKKKNVQK